jgi:lysophospholipase L1-like esterase
MLRYLALGDSYTIGEGLATEASFPYQLQGLLKTAGHEIGDPLIVAKTGWTTGELLDAIHKSELTPPYDLVTLLIGVNNQYRGLSSEEYGIEFGKLLKLAIKFAGDNESAVFVISIPDWSATPFAHDRDRERLSREIDNFNAINLAIAIEHRCNYVSITQGTRDAMQDPTLVTTDGLHPSAKEYAKWARKLVDKINTTLANASTAINDEK